MKVLAWVCLEYGLVLFWRAGAWVWTAVLSPPAGGCWTVRHGVTLGGDCCRSGPEGHDGWAQFGSWVSLESSGRERCDLDHRCEGGESSGLPAFQD